MRARVLAVCLLVPILAGCISDELDEVEDDTGPLPVLGDFVPANITANATFAESLVDAAMGFFSDLYEPTIDVSPSGTIYIAGHTILVDTTGAPAYFSRDDGATWEQLPFWEDHTMPADVHGGTPPPSDEIFIVAGDDGWAYGVDITLFTFPVNMWSGDGARLEHHNPNAYDMVAARSQACSVGSLNDRPWAAYANGTLLMVNNPGGGPVQVGVMDVPPASDLGTPPLPGMGGPEWNLCASPGGWIPGIPDMRDDGLFAVPQVEYDYDTGARRLIVVLGNKADVMDVEVKEVFRGTSGGTVTSDFGQVAFDKQGTMFVGISNNTQADADGKRLGRLKLAVSADDGHSFINRTYTTDGAVQHLYMDGNKKGPGALVVWAVAGAEEGRSDWYTAHLFVGADGGPVLENIVLAIDEGPRPSGHVTGAAAGPDGRAYLAMYEGKGPGGRPLSVWIQQDGPTLPVPSVVTSVVDGAVAH